MRYAPPATTVRIVAFALPFVALALLTTVPAVLSLSTFLVLVGLLTALGWVARTTYMNGQPAASVAQALHDADYPGSLEHPRGKR